MRKPRPDGTLRFNWRVAMLKPDFAEYVVVHELAHLRIRNHSVEFRDLLSPIIPMPSNAVCACARPTGVFRYDGPLSVVHGMSS